VTRHDSAGWKTWCCIDMRLEGPCDHLVCMERPSLT
jgi:hypothetical protein